MVEKSRADRAIIALFVIFMLMVAGTIVYFVKNTEAVKMLGSDPCAICEARTDKVCTGIIQYPTLGGLNDKLFGQSPSEWKYKNNDI